MAQDSTYNSSFDVSRLDSVNFFTRLGLTRETATDADVKEAYRTLNLLCRSHPTEDVLWRDRTQVFITNEAAYYGSDFQRLNDAYRALFSYEKRKAYERTDPHGYEPPPPVPISTDYSHSEGYRDEEDILNGMLTEQVYIEIVLLSNGYNFRQTNCTSVFAWSGVMRSSTRDPTAQAVYHPIMRRSSPDTLRGRTIPSVDSNSGFFPTEPKLHIGKGHLTAPRDLRIRSE